MHLEVPATVHLAPLRSQPGLAREARSVLLLPLHQRLAAPVSTHNLPLVPPHPPLARSLLLPALELSHLAVHQVRLARQQRQPSVKLALAPHLVSNRNQPRSAVFPNRRTQLSELEGQLLRLLEHPLHPRLLVQPLNHQLSAHQLLEQQQTPSRPLLLHLQHQHLPRVLILSVERQ